MAGELIGEANSSITSYILEEYVWNGDRVKIDSNRQQGLAVAVSH